MLEKNTERLWKKLLDFLEEGRIIPIIGPELLVFNIEGKQTSLYTYLAEQLANELDINFEAADTLNSVVCRYTSQGGTRQDIYPEIKRAMPSLSKDQFPDALRKLAEIQPLKLFVTTSFDPLLAQVLNRVRYNGDEKTQVLEFFPGADLDNDLPVTLKELDRTTVFHLFGKLSATPEYAVTDEDILEFMHRMQSETYRPSFLFDALIKQYLMVIGCPFSGWLGRFFVRIGKKDRLIIDTGKTDFLSANQFQTETKLERFLHNFSQQTEVFPMSSIEFVNELHRRWIDLHPIPYQQDDLPQQKNQHQEIELKTLDSMQNGAVFLSYASEDRVAVMLIRNSLEEAGIDVWFDRNPDALRPGEKFEQIIKSNIDMCSLFIPIISKNTLTPKPRFFRKEWKYAEDLSVGYPENWRFIIPVVIDDTPKNASAIPKKIRDLHWQEMQSEDTPMEFIIEIKRLYRDYQRSLAQPA